VRVLIKLYFSASKYSLLSVSLFPSIERFSYLGEILGQQKNQFVFY
jgi:hypothetical protein